MSIREQLKQWVFEDWFFFIFFAAQLALGLYYANLDDQSKAAIGKESVLRLLMTAHIMLDLLFMKRFERRELDRIRKRIQ